MKCCSEGILKWVHLTPMFTVWAQIRRSSGRRRRGRRRQPGRLLCDSEGRTRQKYDVHAKFPRHLTLVDESIWGSTKTNFHYLPYLSKVFPHGSTFILKDNAVVCCTQSNHQGPDSIYIGCLTSIDCFTATEEYWYIRNINRMGVPWIV